MTGVRQKLNESPLLGVGVAAAVVLLALALLYTQVGGNSAEQAPTQAFFTDDKGKTYFKDDINKLAPFDHNGKQAYRADVFKCAEAHEFVGLLYRFTEPGRKEMESYISRKIKDPGGSMRSSIEQRGMQVKRLDADDKTWTLNDELVTERLRASVKCPSGKPAELVVP